MPSFIRKMRNPRTSSSNLARASFSNPGQQNQSHALSAAESKPESNYWRDTDPPRADTGVRHLECSGAILESKRIALIPTTIVPHPTAWQPPDRTCVHRSAEAHGRRLPPRTKVQGHGKRKEMIVIHTEFNNETRRLSEIHGNSIHILRQPSCDKGRPTSHSQPLACATFIRTSPMAQRGGISNHESPLVTEHQRGAITGDANKSANADSKLQNVYNPDQGLIHYIIQKHPQSFRRGFDGEDSFFSALIRVDEDSCKKHLTRIRVDVDPCQPTWVSCACS